MSRKKLSGSILSLSLIFIFVLLSVPSSPVNAVKPSVQTATLLETYQGRGFAYNRYRVPATSEQSSIFIDEGAPFPEGATHVQPICAVETYWAASDQDISWSCTWDESTTQVSNDPFAHWVQFNVAAYRSGNNDSYVDFALIALDKDIFDVLAAQPIHIPNETEMSIPTDVPQNASFFVTINTFNTDGSNDFSVSTLELIGQIDSTERTKIVATKNGESGSYVDAYAYVIVPPAPCLHPDCLGSIVSRLPENSRSETFNVYAVGDGLVGPPLGIPFINTLDKGNKDESLWGKATSLYDNNAQLTVSIEVERSDEALGSDTQSHIVWDVLLFQVPVNDDVVIETMDNTGTTSTSNPTLFEVSNPIVEYENGVTGITIYDRQGNLSIYGFDIYSPDGATWLTSSPYGTHNNLEPSSYHIVLQGVPQYSIDLEVKQGQNTRVIMPGRGQIRLINSAGVLMNAGFDLYDIETNNWLTSSLTGQMGFVGAGQYHIKTLTIPPIEDTITVQPGMITDFQLPDWGHISLIDENGVFRVVSLNLYDQVTNTWLGSSLYGDMSFVLAGNYTLQIGTVPNQTIPITVLPNETLLIKLSPAGNIALADSEGNALPLSMSLYDVQSGEFLTSGIGTLIGVTKGTYRLDYFDAGGNLLQQEITVSGNTTMVIRVP